MSFERRKTEETQERRERKTPRKQRRSMEEEVERPREGEYHRRVGRFLLGELKRGRNNGGL